jgi:hypothetical protein
MTSAFLKQGVCHTVALPFTLKRILRQKNNYGNSNTSPLKLTFGFDSDVVIIGLILVPD